MARTAKIRMMTKHKDMPAMVMVLSQMLESSTDAIGMTTTDELSADRVSRGSSISSTKSNGRKIKVKATVENSPKPPVGLLASAMALRLMALLLALPNTT
jgi:hypothetical protein